MNNENWDDIRYVLAVVEHGSLNAAASVLGVTHATVLRRISGFEERIGEPIFQKNKSGYKLLDEAVPILDAAETVEAAVFKMKRAINGSNARLKGRVRIASTDSLCQVVLPSVFLDIKQAYPDIELALLSSNYHHDLSRMSADIVVRPAEKLSDELVGEVVGALEMGIYAKNQTVTSWLGLHGALGRSLPAQWMERELPKEVLRYGADSFLTLRHLAQLGHGKTFLPSFLGDGQSGLVRIREEDPSITVPVWIAQLEDAAQAPRFSIIRKALAANLRANKMLNRDTK